MMQVTIIDQHTHRTAARMHTIAAVTAALRMRDTDVATLLVAKTLSVKICNFHIFHTDIPTTDQENRSAAAASQAAVLLRITLQRKIPHNDICTVYTFDHQKNCLNRTISVL